MIRILQNFFRDPLNQRGRKFVWFKVNLAQLSRLRQKLWQNIPTVKRLGEIVASHNSDDQVNQHMPEKFVERVPWKT